MEGLRLTVRIYDLRFANRVEDYIRRQKSYGKSQNVIVQELIAAGLNGNSAQLDRIERKVDDLSNRQFVAVIQQPVVGDEVETDIDAQLDAWG